MLNTDLLTHGEACLKLRALGFEHTDKAPKMGTGRIPARGKGPLNTSTALSWTADRKALHWYEFTTNERGTIFAGDRSTYDRAETARRIRQAKEKRRQAEFEKQAMQSVAAKEAQIRWRAATTVGTHPYIHRKGLSSLHNARLDRYSEALLIPMRVLGVGLVNLQRIYPDPDRPKLYLKGARSKGAWTVIGSLHGAECVLVTEGWATGATLFELHDLPVVVAFDAGNLMSVCQVLRSHLKSIAVVVAGDDDRQNTINTGRHKAIAAAEAIGARLLFPALCKCCKCTDHNDAALCPRWCNNG